MSDTPAPGEELGRPRGSGSLAPISGFADPKLLQDIADDAEACANEALQRHPADARFKTSAMFWTPSVGNIMVETACRDVLRAVSDYREVLGSSFGGLDYLASRGDVGLDDYRAEFGEIMDHIRKMHYQVMQFSSLFDGNLLGSYKRKAEKIKQTALAVVAGVDARESTHGFKATGRYVLDSWRAAAASVATMPMTDNPADWGIERKPGGQAERGR